MDFQATGKISYLGAIETGESQKTGAQWKRQRFVLECDDREHTMIPMTAANRVLDEITLTAGALVNVRFDIRGHEYNGRWFSENSAWKIERV